MSSPSFISSHFTDPGGMWLIAVGGPSRIGKTALIDHIISKYARIYRRPKSVTSRQRRDGEGLGEYVFVVDAEIERLYAEGKLLNLDVAYGNKYGIDLAHLQQLCQEHIRPIKEIHPQNQDALKNKLDEMIGVLVLPRGGLVRQRENEDHRLEEDAKYYQNVEDKKFDIVLHIDPGDSLDNAAEWLHFAICAAIISKHLPISTASLSNRHGYESLATEFTDDLRPTTRDFHRMSQHFLQDVIARYVRSGQHVLEIGAGRGWLRETFAWPALTYTAVDISFQMLSLSKNRDFRCVASAEYLPFRSAVFDTVFCILMDPFCYPRPLCEIRRVLKRSGYLIFTAPCGEWARRLRPEAAKHMTEFVKMDGSRVTVASFAYSSEQLFELLHACGFEILAMRQLSSGLLGELSTCSAAIREVVGPHEDMPVLNAVIATPAIKEEF
jgi:guanylate kinase/ubiquinone/menaquinone biosynthesis C-methylase UbiE